MEFSKSKLVHALRLAFLIKLSLLSHTFAERIPNTTLALPLELPTGDYTFETVDWFQSGIVITSPADQANQLFVVERRGRIILISDVENWIREPTPFLDISNRVRTNGENGFLGLAFHPNYRENGFFYAFYTTNEDGTNYNRISRFTRSNENPQLADPDSELILLDQFDQANNHNGGDLHFGPDAFLYASLGDEGGANDQYNNGQKIENDFFAGIIRLDVDKASGIEPTAHPAIPTDGSGARFTIPSDNPLVADWQSKGSDPDSPLRLEFYAIGLRNPWRMSFDPATGKLWVADVGQNKLEEVDIVEKGGNYGWPNREGSIAGPKSPSIPAQFQSLSDPILEYEHSEGRSITGGIVYRGSKIPELEGAYIFGDFNSGDIWYAFEPAPGETAEKQLIGNIPFHFVYGRDPNNGDVLVSGSSGALQRLVRGEGNPTPSFPATLSATGAFKNLETLTPEEGLLQYDINLPFWSDHAKKTRWTYIPYDQEIGYALNEAWTFPIGSIWVKHFELETERGDPDSRKRIETRFIVKTAESVYGISYQWNEAQTEAFLVPSEGAQIEIDVVDAGENKIQQWNIPSRNECLQCHSANAGYALSFNVRQLNRSQTIDETEQNLLSYLNDEGYFDDSISDPASLPQHYAVDDHSISLEKRARSYLETNCANCHQANGAAPFTWDARSYLSIDDTGLFDGIPNNNGGQPQRRLAIRGNPEDSVLLSRIAATHDFTRMPPLASSKLDLQGIDLITRWLQAPVNQTYAEWVIERFGAPDALNSEKSDDPDFDGFNNLHEFIKRTDPLDSESRPSTKFTVDNNQLALAIDLTPDRGYTIESSNDLNTWSEWTPSTPHPIADPVNSQETVIPISSDNQPLYLRIRTTDQ